MFSDSLQSVFQSQIVAGGSPDQGLGSSFWTRPDGFIRLQHFRAPKSVSYEPHIHSEYNVVICLAGAVTKRQMGVEETIEPGEAFMGNLGVEHTSNYLVGSKGCETICLTADRRIFSELLGEPRTPDYRRSPVFLGKIRSNVLSACALDSAEEIHRREVGYPIVLEGLVMRMLVEALRLWPQSRVERCEVDSTPRLPRREFVRAYEFMRWCRKDAFRVDQLCRFLGTSEERFTRLFRAATHVSPASFYNRLLLERGRDLLQDRSLSIKEISYQLGFRTSSHFVASFHRQFGTTPVDFRDRSDRVPVAI